MGGYWQLVFVCCLLVQSLSAEDSVKGNSTSAVNDNSTSAVNDNSTSAVDPDKELEKNIEQRIASLRETGQDEIRDIALEYFNSRKGSVFTTLEDATVTAEKAIGSMVYLRMTVEKTNCTKKDINSRRFFPFPRFSDSENKEPPKHCGPLAGEDKEQLECKFDIFQNERSFGEAVVSHDCEPVKVIDRRFILSKNPKRM